MQPASYRTARALCRLPVGQIAHLRYSVTRDGRAIMPRKYLIMLGLLSLPVLAQASDVRVEIGTGTASYYGKELHGNRTANGERFDAEALTAAHRSLPFGSRVAVTNLANGQEVVVRVNDRGPWSKSRIMDISYGAARQIGMHRSGTAKVRLELLD